MLETERLTRALEAPLAMLSVWRPPKRANLSTLNAKVRDTTRSLRVLADIDLSWVAQARQAFQSDARGPTVFGYRARVCALFQLAQRFLEVTSPTESPVLREVERLLPRIAPELRHAQEEARSRVQSLLTMTSAALSIDETPEQAVELDALLERWERETEYLSSVTKIVAHPAAREIVQRGVAVVGPLLKRIAKEPTWVSWLLFELTGANPIAPEHHGRLEESAADWVAWGREHGFRV